MTTIAHLTMEELDAGLEHIRRAPKDQGVLELIVRRPVTREREVLTKGQLDLAEGLVGDNWSTRGSSMIDHGKGQLEMQLNIMNSRAVAHVAQGRERWQLAGDQLFIDMDLSDENLPPGTQLGIGTAVIAITDQPHNGCKKFVARFGLEAMKFVNSAVGKQLHLRGINARVIQPGVIRVGAAVVEVH